MTSDESTVLAAYVSRELDLPAPPTFLTCTASSLTRAAFMVYNQSHIETTLLADVPARIRLGRNIARRSILRELVDANGGTDQGKTRMKAFIKAAERVVFDGHHTLSFVFMSNKAAASWAGTDLKLRGCSLTLEMAGIAIPGIRTPPQVARHYVVRVLGLKDADNDNWTIIFSTLDCPEDLQGTTAHTLGEQNVIFITTNEPQQRHAGDGTTQTILSSTSPTVPNFRDLVSLERRFAEYVGAITTGVPLTAEPTRAFLEEVPAENDEVSEFARQQQDPGVDATGWKLIRRNKSAVTSVSGRASGLQQVSTKTGTAPNYKPGRTAVEAAQQSGDVPRQRTTRAKDKEKVSKPTTTTTAAQRYKDTCAAYAALEADSEGEDDITSPYPLTGDSSDPSASNLNTVDVQPQDQCAAAELDVDMDVAATGTEKTLQADVFAGMHSPSSETQPSQ
ncbi:hypothetical protein PHMEG_00011124 [Phytophthora megakarya]|uniref:Uncharacterized protein n=1 Tax=Phytophthora megakarya TaxID=4795 RepID=A0A225WCI4_9STRA|nr:hypothetical protein PHMEG_00011124 [Phytophthora megakarya]